VKADKSFLGLAVKAPQRAERKVAMFGFFPTNMYIIYNA